MKQSEMRGPSVKIHIIAADAGQGIVEQWSTTMPCESTREAIEAGGRMMDAVEESLRNGVR